MASAKPLQDVVFAPGVREDFDPAVAPPGTLARAENVLFGRKGGVYPRPGSTAVSASVMGTGNEMTSRSSDAGFAGSVRGIGVLGVDGDVYAYSAEDNLFGYGGSYPTVQPVRQRIGLVSETGGISSAGGAGREGNKFGVAAVGDSLMIAASDGVNVHYRIETGDGRTLWDDVRTGTHAAIAVSGSVYYLVIQNGTALTIWPFTVSSGTVTAGSSASGATLFSSSADWDVSSFDGTNWFLAFQATPTIITVSQRAGTAQTASASFPVVGTVNLSLYTDSARVWVGYYDPNNVTYRIYGAPGLAVVLGATVLVAGANLGPPLFGPSGSGTDAFYVYQLASASLPGTGTGIATVSGAGTSTGLTAWGVVPVSKPDARRRVWVKLNGSIGSISPTMRHLLLRFWAVPSAYPPMLELETPVTVPTAAAVDRIEFHAVATLPSSTAFAVPRLARSDLGGSMYKLDVYEYETSDQNPLRQFREVGGTGVIAGGVPYEIFGRSSPFFGATDAQKVGAYELGFGMEPAVVQATQTAGGSMTALGTYKYLFVFEWLAPNGDRHRSDLSKVTTVVLTVGNQSVTFTLLAITFSQRINTQFSAGGSGSIVIHAYRTVNGGNDYYRITPSIGATVAYDPTDGLVTWSDDSAITDASLITQELLYTDGGVKPNVLAPASRYVAVSEERIALAGLWDPRIIHFSKIIVPGEPVQFADHDSFRAVLRGPCTGIAFQDGQLVAFEEEAINVIGGDGPNDQGIGSFFPPRRIAPGRGCANGLSVLETDIGVLFQSKRGIEVMPRGNGLPVFIGAPVQRTVRDFPICLGAVLHTTDEHRTAQFLMTEGDHEQFRRLVLDLDLTQELGYPVWSVYTLPSFEYQTIGQWPTGTMVPVADINSSDNFAGLLDTYAMTEGTDATSTEDIESLVETTQLRFAGLAGWYRVNSATALVTNPDGGELRLTVSTDQSGTPTGTQRTWALSATANPQYRTVCPEEMVTSSTVVRLSCARTGNVFGAAFHGVTLEIDAQLGARRTTEAER